MTNSSPTELYVVEVDTRSSGLSSYYPSFQDKKCNAKYFEEKIKNHPGMMCVSSPVAELCGLSLKLYFSKYAPGLDTTYREGGTNGVMYRIMQNSRIIASNNGAATFLLTIPETGFSTHIVESKAYVLQDDGATPLSRDQVWGITEMINCAMGIYDMDPVNMAKGKETIERWSHQYRQGTFHMPSGDMGLKIFSGRED